MGHQYPEEQGGDQTWVAKPVALLQLGATSKPPGRMGGREGEGSG